MSAPEELSETALPWFSVKVSSRRFRSNDCQAEIALSQFFSKMHPANMRLVSRTQWMPPPEFAFPRRIVNPMTAAPLTPSMSRTRTLSPPSRIVFCEPASPKRTSRFFITNGPA